MRYLLPALASLCTMTACSGDFGSSDAETGGTLVISAGTDPDYLLPPVITSLVGRQVQDLVFYRLAELRAPINTLGDAGFEPRLAERWTWADDSMSVAFHLDPDARWHDGAPVRAEDIVLSHALYIDPVVASPGSVYFDNVDSVTARDSLTAVVWFERRKAEQFYEFVHNLIPLPSHLLRGADRAQLRASELATQPVGNGPYRLARWERGARLELIADTSHWRGRPRIDRVIWTSAKDPTTAVTRLLAGEADLYESMRPDNIGQAAQDSMLKLVPYPSMQYAFLQFNTRDARNRARPHPLFGDRALRRALSMAVDRRRLVHSIYDSLAHVALGPFPRAIAADTVLRHLPYDPDAARRLLDSLGWRDANGDGIRERNGIRLAFSIMTPSTSRPRVNAAVILQEQLKLVGAQVDIEQLDFNAFLERQAARRFDAWLGVWQTDPTPSGIRQTWGSRGESNFGGYASASFDALVDSAIYAADPAAGAAYYRRAYQTIIDDAPGVWLYEPRLVAGVHRRVRMAGMRADAWWIGIPQWSIPVDERIARDRIPLVARTE